MAVEQQRTLASSAKISGRGLFTGASVTATIHPAEAGTGIRFERSDLPGSEAIPASVEHVVARPRRTALQRGDAVVETVEHCLSGLAGMGVDNAVVQVEGPELPAGDGSAMPFVTAIENAGLVDLDEARDPLVVREPVTIREGDAMIAAFPNGGAGMDVLYDLDYGPTSVISRQIHAFTLEPRSYQEKIAPARTFSTLSDAEKLREAGLFQHLSPKEMLVIGDAGPIDNAFRFEDEPVRHKLLDLIGDLSLVGRPLHGRVVASRSGHALNQKLAKALVEQDRDAGQELAPAMDIRQIMRLLPHRYPMVLVDRVLELESDQRAVGVKNVSINEPFFQGHYPGSPIMPGVLIVEAMSQLGGLMLSRKLERTGKIAVLLSLDKVKLRHPVRPGDQLVMEAETMRATSRFGEVAARAFVAGNMVAEAMIKFMMVDAEQE